MFHVWLSPKFSLRSNSHSCFARTIRYKLKTHRDTVDLWITECEEAVAVLTPGTDIDHNELLQKQFDNFRADLASNETRLEEVCSGCLACDRAVYILRATKRL